MNKFLLVAQTLTCLILLISSPAASFNLLPMHAIESGAPGCTIGDPCAEFTVDTEVTVGSMFNAYLMARYFDDLAGVQTAFDWPSGWALLFSLWNCQPNQLTAMVPTGPGGANGTVATAFDCVTGGETAVIGFLVMLATEPGCIRQVESSFPFGTHAVDCTGNVQQVFEADRGAICAGMQGCNTCEIDNCFGANCFLDGPFAGAVGEPVQFDANVAAESYTWDFGDGTNGTGQAPTHVYTGPGVYDVSVHVDFGICCPPRTCSSVAVIEDAVPIAPSTWGRIKHELLDGSER